MLSAGRSGHEAVVVRRRPGGVRQRTVRVPDGHRTAAAGTCRHPRRRRPVAAAGRSWHRHRRDADGQLLPCTGCRRASHPARQRRPPSTTALSDETSQRRDVDAATAIASSRHIRLNGFIHARASRCVTALRGAVRPPVQCSPYGNASGVKAATRGDVRRRAVPHRAVSGVRPIIYLHCCLDFIISSVLANYSCSKRLKCRLGRCYLCVKLRVL